MADPGALPPEVVEEIVLRLPIKHIPAAACVCRAWHRAAGGEAMLRAAFGRKWALARVAGAPNDRSFWQKARLDSFAAEHKPLRPGDTLAKLALKHGVAMHELKRMNGVMNDTALATRTRALIPFTSSSHLAGRGVVVQEDAHLRRPVAVVDASEADSDAGASASEPDEGRKGRDGAGRKGTAAEEALAKRFGVSKEEARAYLSLADNNTRRAAEYLLDDRDWDGR